MPEPTLVLWDIDGTLITTGGVGQQSMLEGAADLLGRQATIDGIAFAGRLDPLIFHDLLIANGAEPTGPLKDSLYIHYRRRLEARLARHVPRHLLSDPDLADAPDPEPFRGRPMPGVLDLLDAMQRTPGITLGLLTGNLPETGSLKLHACGIDPARFDIQVWGGDSPHSPPERNHLPAVGIERYRSRFNRGLDPRRVVIIGDTPHDVACARAGCCRSLGVATGRFSLDDLAAAGADHAVLSLDDTDRLLRWIVEPTVPPSAPPHGWCSGPAGHDAAPESRATAGS